MQIDKLKLSKKNLSDKRILSRIITAVESDDKLAREVINYLYDKTGNAYRIGITGPPGAGKSTITNQLTKILLDRNFKVGIIAIDPTSPFTGGALLGDRIRMSEIGMRENSFIRSMASRGSLGGLSKKAIDTADILDAAGYDIIIFETVGVGQSELDIAKTADTTIVVLVPESGDSIQAMKAGLMEIADLFVLNKSDRPGADSAFSSLKSILMFRDHSELNPIPRIVKAIATENIGIENILDEIFIHKNFMGSDNILIKKRFLKIKSRIKEIVESDLQNEIWNLYEKEKFDDDIENIIESKLSVYHLAEQIIKNYKNEIKKR